MYENRINAKKPPALALSVL